MISKEELIALAIEAKFELAWVVEDTEYYACTDSDIERFATLIMSREQGEAITLDLKYLDENYYIGGSFGMIAAKTKQAVIADLPMVIEKTYELNKEHTPKLIVLVDTTPTPDFNMALDMAAKICDDLAEAHHKLGTTDGTNNSHDYISGGCDACSEAILALRKPDQNATHEPNIAHERVNEAG